MPGLRGTDARRQLLSLSGPASGWLMRTVRRLSRFADSRPKSDTGLRRPPTRPAGRAEALAGGGKSLSPAHEGAPPFYHFCPTRIRARLAGVSLDGGEEGHRERRPGAPRPSDAAAAWGAEQAPAARRRNGGLLVFKPLAGMDDDAVLQTSHGSRTPVG